IDLPAADHFTKRNGRAVRPPRPRARPRLGLGDARAAVRGLISVRIHVSDASAKKDVDARHKAWHDESNYDHRYQSRGERAPPLEAMRGFQGEWRCLGASTTTIAPIFQRLVGSITSKLGMLR